MVVRKCRREGGWQKEYVMAFKIGLPESADGKPALCFVQPTCMGLDCRRGNDVVAVVLEALARPLPRIVVHDGGQERKQEIRKGSHLRLRIQPGRPPPFDLRSGLAQL